MIRGSAKLALLAGVVVLAGCQALQMPGVTRAGTPMDGQWASTDGVFVATFQGKQFTSRFVKTNEILAQGSYTVTGGNVQMQWLSVATQQQRSASCSFTGPDTVHCNQTGSGGFDLRRTA
jgi:hypothetical protein